MMQFTLKKTVRILLCAGVVVLGACSSLHRHPPAGEDMQNDEAVQTAGAGEADALGESAAGQSLRGRTYYFAFDSSEIRPSDRPAVLANAAWLSAHPDAHIILEGHTDPRGSREYNVALGERRANAVFDLLKDRGVRRDQVRVVSYGAERLAVAGRTEADYQLDRRAVILKEQG